MIYYNLGWTDNGWEDLRVPMSSTKKGGTKDPDFIKFLDNGSGSQGVFAYAFDKTTEEELYFAVQMPHGWKQGTTIYPHVHWAGLTLGEMGTKVCWGLEYTFVDIEGVFSDTTIIYDDTPDGWEALDPIIAKKHYLTNINGGTGIDTSGITGVSAMMLCRIFRDATGAGGTDDYPADAFLLEFDLHYRAYRAGSPSISGP